jgi:hypothetical protein
MTKPGTKSQHLTTYQKIQILLEEYRALYALLTLRLSAMDRRLPVASSILAVLLGSLTSLPTDAQVMFLWALPATLICLMRTTTNHSRSKEDVLRCIAAIERRINQASSDVLMMFQSRHPSRLRVVGGRTGWGVVLAVAIACLLMLIACGRLYCLHAANSLWELFGYLFYTAVCAIDIALGPVRVRRYRPKDYGYAQIPSPGQPR